MRSILLIADLILGAGAGTNVVVQSEAITEKAWERKVVMVGDDNRIINDDGKIGEAADVALLDESATIAAEVADAANQSMTNALQTLIAASANAATDSVGFFVAIPPETSRDNFTGYVVKTTSDGTNDTQYVWYNRQFDLPPARFVEYRGIADTAVIKVEWVNWTNTVAVTAGGVRWDGCRVCTCRRPTFAYGLPCVDLPNDLLGGSNGVDWGDMLITVNQTPAFTGVITNGVTGAVLYFDNGFMKNNEE